MVSNHPRLICPEAARPTPETDARLESLHTYADGTFEIGPDKNGAMVRADFARQLERQRDEARNEAAEHKQAVIDAMSPPPTE